MTPGTSSIPLSAGRAARTCHQAVKDCRDATGPEALHRWVWPEPDVSGARDISARAGTELALPSRLVHPASLFTLVPRRLLRDAERLSAKLGEAYSTYATRVRRWIPFVV